MSGTLTDGAILAILTDALKKLKNDEEWEQNVDAHLKPKSIAHVRPYMFTLQTFALNIPNKMIGLSLLN